MHASLLVHVTVGTAAVGDLGEQHVDRRAAGEGVPVPTVGVVGLVVLGHAHSRMVSASRRRARYRRPRKVGSETPRMAAASS